MPNQAHAAFIHRSRDEAIRAPAVAPAIRGARNVAGNERVARLVGTVRRNGPYELDFGPAPPSMITDRKMDQNNRLRSFASWLAASYKKLKWLGLFDSDAPTDSMLAQGIEWARTHIDMWLEADEPLEEDLMAEVRQVQQLGFIWLSDREQRRFAEAEATQVEARDLGLNWLADAIAKQRRSIESALTSAGAYFGKPLNRAGAALDKSVATWKALLPPIEKALSDYEPIRIDYAEILELTRDALDGYAPLPYGKQITRDLASMEKKVRIITTAAEKATASPRGGATTEDTLKAAAMAYGTAVGRLKKLHDEMYALGALQEKAVDLAKRQSGTARTQRTNLPKMTETDVAGGSVPTGEMLVQAVREAKTPEWKQAAVDFILDKLARGRPDHIHICGGGNTLIYRDRLIRGFMTEHLDSRKVSQLQFKKILYRETTNPVRVAVKGNNLYEVVPG